MLEIIGLAVALAAVPSTPAVPEVKLICKRLEDNSTGTRLAKSKRICRTAAEWRAIDDETSRALRRTKDKGLVDPNSIARGR